MNGKPACGEHGATSLVDHGQGVKDVHGTPKEFQMPKGRPVDHPHGTERVSESHLGAKKY